MNTSLLPIYEQYNLLLPSRREGMVVFGLYEKIKNKEIDPNFTYQDIELVIKETSNLEMGSGVPHTEQLLQNLLHNFIERPAEKKSRYTLTDYAMGFISLVDHKLNNPFRKFPLRDSFERYTSFEAKQIEHFYQFDSWYEQGFNYTTRKNIIDHLEALKEDVTNAIHELNHILSADEANVLEAVSQFSIIFKELGRKADEIKDTLRLGSSLNEQLQQVTTYFYSKVADVKHPETEEEQKTFDTLERDYQQSETIHKNVRDFFVIINEKLGQLNAKILFASEKLNELKENFKYQTRFKINLKRMLEFVLMEGRYSPKEFLLPKDFPIAVIPFEETKFISVPYIESFLPPINLVRIPSVDTANREEERIKINHELQKLKRTAIWLKRYKDLLEHDKELDFTKHFYEILEQEQDPEISLQVGFELLQFANESPKYNVSIKRNIPDGLTHKSILTWEMKIKQKEKAS